jgi:alkylation response protein AidB-like acyl-CoA dehydrogenase
VTRDAEAVRAEVRAWLAANWDPERPLVEWRRLLVDAGWAFPAWPPEHHGRGLPPELAAVVAEELRRAGAVGPPVGVGTGLVAPTILVHGPDAARRRFLRPIATGEARWCQLFSEPDAGSDLASLTTRAIPDGDEWVVTGQKVWTTGAATADFGLLLARTDPAAPRHAGITCFALPMRQPGVEVRPLRQMNGHASFNQVFITDARVPAAYVVGEVGGGWAVARTTLALERELIASIAAALPPSGPGRTRQEAAAEAAAYLATYSWYPQRAGRPDLVIPQARATGAAADPLVRQEIARLVTLQRVAAWNAARARAARERGATPGPEGSLAKLTASRIARAAAHLHARIAGAHATLTGPGSPLDGVVAEVLVSVPAQSIAGGTDEIQKSILAERWLGLPRDPGTA